MGSSLEVVFEAGIDTRLCCCHDELSMGLGPSKQVESFLFVSSVRGLLGEIESILASRVPDAQVMLDNFPLVEGDLEPVGPAAVGLDRIQRLLLGQVSIIECLSMLGTCFGLELLVVAAGCNPLQDDLIALPIDQSDVASGRTVRAGCFDCLAWNPFEHG